MPPRPLTRAKVIEQAKAGATIIVRAKNGSCFPSFRFNPDAYRCKVGKRAASSRTIKKLIDEGVIECIKRDWYSEGHFRLAEKRKLT